MSSPSLFSRRQVDIAAATGRLHLEVPCAPAFPSLPQVLLTDCAIHPNEGHHVHPHFQARSFTSSLPPPSLPHRRLPHQPLLMLATALLSTHSPMSPSPSLIPARPTHMAAPSPAQHTDPSILSPLAGVGFVKFKSNHVTCLSSPCRGHPVLLARRRPTWSSRHLQPWSGHTGPPSALPPGQGHVLTMSSIRTL